MCSQVRSLEQKNKLLEAEIEAYQNRFQKPSGLRLLYEEQLKELKKIAEKMRVQRVRHNILCCSSSVPLLPLQMFKQGVKLSTSLILEAPLEQRYKTSTWCFQGSLPGKTRLFLAGKSRGASVSLGVAEYSCHQLCFMHR